MGSSISRSEGRGPNGLSKNISAVANGMKKDGCPTELVGCGITSDVHEWANLKSVPITPIIGFVFYFLLLLFSDWRQPTAVGLSTVGSYSRLDLQ